MDVKLSSSAVLVATIMVIITAAKNDDKKQDYPEAASVVSASVKEHNVHLTNIRRLHVLCRNVNAARPLYTMTRCPKGLLH